MIRRKALFSLMLLVVLACGVAAAQHSAAEQQSHSAPAQQPSSHEAQPQNPHEQHAGEKPSEATGTQGGIEGQLSHTSDEAAGHEAEGHDGHAEFKYSSSVKWLAGVTGLDVKKAYWVFLALNFLILGASIFFIARKSLPAALRGRTEAIRLQMDEAQKASAEANARLASIEQRLARLDGEVAEMRAASERESIAEEARIAEAAELDKKKIVEAAESEIDAAAKAARRDLKAYAADLAVALAEKRIAVGPELDKQLVRNFTDQLSNGREGK